MADRREAVIGYADNLSYGPINPPTPLSRIDWKTEVLGFVRDEWDWLNDEVETFWRKALAPDVHRIVWMSRWCAVEYAGFLEFVWRLAEPTFQVIDLTNVKVTKRRTGEEVLDWAFSVGHIRPEIIAGERLWDRSRTPDLSDLEGWNRD
jgi:hypothetical protein